MFRKITLILSMGGMLSIINIITHNHSIGKNIWLLGVEMLMYSASLLIDKPNIDLAGHHTATNKYIVSKHSKVYVSGVYCHYHCYSTCNDDNSHYIFLPLEIYDS